MDFLFLQHKATHKPKPNPTTTYHHFPHPRQLANQNQTTNLKPTTTNQFSATIKPNSVVVPNKTRSNLTHGNPKPDHFFNSFFTDKPKPTTKPYQFFSLETHNQTHSTQQSNPRQPTHPRRKPIKPQRSEVTDTDHQTPPKWILNGAGKKTLPLGGEVCGRVTGSPMGRS